MTISDDLKAEQEAAMQTIRRVFEQLAAGIPGFDEQETE
jgi:hypothetical protein